MKKRKFKNLDLLITGQFISQIGDKFYALALAFWVLQTTGSPEQHGNFLDMLGLSREEISEMRKRFRREP